MRFKVSRGVAVAWSAFALAGVASAADPVPDHSPAPPVLAQAIHVRIQALEPGDSGPAGAYRVPDSEVVVSGQQVFSRHMAPPYGATALDPLVAAQPAPDIEHHVMIDGLNARAVAEERAALALSDADAKLHLHLDAEAQGDLATALAGGTYEGRILATPGLGPTLVLRHSIALTVTDLGVYRPHVVLAAQLADADGRVLWRGTYSASTGGEHHLTGADGWVAGDGAALNASVSASLAAVIRVVLADVAHPFPRELAQLKTARVHVPYELARYDVAAYVLSDDGRFVALTPRNVDKPVVAGVILIDKGEVELRAGGERDRSERVDDDVHKLESKTRHGRRDQRRAESRIVIEARFGTSKGPVTPTPVEPEDADEPVTASPPALREQPSATVAGPIAHVEASVAPAQPLVTPVPPAAPAPPVDVSRLTSKTWRFPHPRDPARFGDLRFEFHGQRLMATNAVSSSWGEWTATGDQLCVKFSSAGWSATCYRVVDAGSGRLDVVSAAGQRGPLTVK